LAATAGEGDRWIIVVGAGGVEAKGQMDEWHVSVDSIVLS